MMCRPTQSTPATDTTDDAALMQCCRDDDPAAFRLLIERHQDKLVNFFGRMGVHNDSEDLTQETFLKIFRYRHRYRKRAKFTTYLYSVARNVYIDYARKAGRRQKGLQQLTIEQQVADDIASHKRVNTANDQEIAAALDCLSPKLRMVVVLAFFEGQDYRTIGRILKVPVGTVKSRMHMAIGRLRFFMKNQA